MESVAHDLFRPLTAIALADGAEDLASGGSLPERLYHIGDVLRYLPVDAAEEVLDLFRRQSLRTAVLP
jgi:hypothetical protein